MSQPRSDAERIAEDVLGQERVEIANATAAGVTLDPSPAMAAALDAATSLSPEELVAQAANAPVPTAEELASLAAATAVAVPHSAIPAPVLTDEDAAEAVTTEAAKKARPGRRAHVLRWGARLLTFAITIALFVGGVALGSALFERTQPPPPVVGDPSTGGVPTPPVVKELADALASNDADSLRSAVSGDPYRLLAGELQSWNMQGVTSVKTLATMHDGPRSATEIIITGKSASGDPLVFNLVVHVTDNQIVNFR